MPRNVGEWPCGHPQSTTPEEHEMNRTTTTTNSPDQRHPNQDSHGCETLGLTSIGRMIDPRLCLLMSSIAGVAITVGLTG